MATGRLALTVVAVLAALALSPAPATAGSNVNCKPSPLEIVFAIDASSSLGPANYGKIKKFVQDVAAHLPIGEKETRPAIISFSNAAKVEINLAEANDLQAFKSGVDAIPFYRGFTVTGEAMNLARTQVFTKARSGATKLLVVVTDGKPTHPGERDEPALVRAESAALRAQGVRIYAIGIGGVWLTDVLKEIAGSNDYSMINDFDNLMAIVDNLVKDICDVKCDNLGQESFPGQCFNGTQRIVHVSRTHNKALRRCEKAITTEYKYCGTSHLCQDVDVKVEDCVNGIRNVVTTWEDFDVGQQKCVMRRSVQELDCNAIEQCKEPVADIMYLLDSSGSIKNPDFALQINFVYHMVSNMKVAPGAIHIGVLLYSKGVRMDIPLGAINNQATLLQRIRGIRRMLGGTNTGEALRQSRLQFASRGRPGVAKIAVLMTDGQSNLGPNAVGEAAQLENTGATIMVIGVGQGLAKAELRAIASPPLTDNLFFADDFNKLMNWASKISQETCDSITPPDPSLCDLPLKRLVSECYNGWQKVTEIRYEYDAQGRCNKNVASHSINPCAVRCTDPINGNQYYNGETWQSECDTFVCRRLPTQTSVFYPTARQCPGHQNQCHALTSANKFECRDDRGQLFSHCNCQAQSGNPLLRVITADANAKP